VEPDAAPPGPGQQRPARARRPRDRKLTIALNASTLFAQRGFNSVRMDDIASATGITARAVYRHYTNKQALLSHIVNISQRRYLSALDPVEASGSASDLEPMLAGLAAASLDSTHFAVLWQRESRHLTTDDLDGLRRRLNAMAGRLATAIAASEPRLSTERAEIRAWAVLAILSSPGHHELALARPDYDHLLVAACRAAVGCEPSTAAESAPPVVGRTGQQLVSRREQLLTAAARAFRRSGFQSVGTDEIGEAAGVAGPAIYRYFDTKAEILVTLVRRYLEWVGHESARALAAARPDDPLDALRRLVAGYTRVAVEAPDLVAVGVTEWLDLPPDDADKLQRIRSDNLAEWSHRLCALRPELGRTEASILVSIATILIDDTVRVGHLHRIPGLAAELERLALAVLLSTSR
jgi:AcrR family transcriptional regulator